MGVLEEIYMRTYCEFQREKAKESAMWIVKESWAKQVD